MLAGAAPERSKCPPTLIPVLCHGTGKVTATSIPQAMAHRELEMSHQCVVLAPSAAVMPQQVPPLPGAWGVLPLSSSPNFKGHEHYCICIGTIEDSSCLSSKLSPSPGEEHEKSSLHGDTEGHRGIYCYQQTQLTCTSRLRPQSERRSQPVCTPQSALQRETVLSPRARQHPQHCRASPGTARVIGLTEHHIVIRRDGGCLHRVLRCSGSGRGGEGGSRLAAGRATLQKLLSQPAGRSLSPDGGRGGCRTKPGVSRAV